MPTHYGKMMTAKKPAKKPTKKPNKKVTEKPKFAPRKDLSARQKALMKEHKVHHTKKHMDEMTRLMKKGMCFEQAHEKTMKKIGK